MTTPKSIKIVSIISLASIVAWLLAITMIDILQENLITLFYPGNNFSEGADRTFLASTAVHIISAALITICNILMICGKTSLIPLVLSGCAFLIDPIVSTVAHHLQTAISARLQGEYALVRIAALEVFSGYASYILNISFFCTVAAAAVYGYVKKRGLYNERLE